MFFLKNKEKNKKKSKDTLSEVDNHFEEHKKQIEKLKNTKTINPFKKIKIKQDIRKIEKQIRLAKERKQQKIAFIMLLSICTFILIGLGIMHYRSEVHKIKFFNSEDTIFVGDTLDLQYQVKPASAEYDVEEISVTIDNIGLLSQEDDKYKAIEEGTVKASIVYKNNTYDQKTINIIPILVKSITIQDAEIGINLESDVIVNYFPENSTHKQISLSSLNTEVVKVVGNKLVGVNEGRARITAKSADGPETSFNVEVVYIEPEKLEIKGTRYQYLVGEEFDLSVSYYPEKISNSSPVIRWVSSNNNVVSVEDGHVRCLQRGSAEITASYSDKVYASESINVQYPDPRAITISGNSNQIYKGYTTKLSTTIEPELVENYTIEWSSSDESKATVNAYGIVTAISNGEVTITAKTYNGKSDEYTLLITDPPVTYNNSGSSGNSSGGRIDTGNGSVYISDTSNCFHTKPTCHGMKGAWLVTVEYAKSIGLSACYWCARGY